MIFSNLNQTKILIYLSCLVVPLLVTGPFLPDLLLSSLSLWFLFYVLKNKIFYVFKNNFFYLFLVFCLICVFSSLMSDDILLSFEGSLFYFRIGIFCMLISYLIDKDEKILKYFFYTLVLTFSIVIFYALIEYLFALNKHPTRISSFFGDELIMGSYLSRLLPLIFGLFLIKKNKTNLEKYLFIIFVSFAYFSVFLSGERAAFFYINFSFLFIFCFIRIKFKWILLFSIINIILFYTLVVNSNITTGDRLLNRFTTSIILNMQLHKVLGIEDKYLEFEEENEEKIYKKPKIVDKQIETTSKENNIGKKDKVPEKNEKTIIMFSLGHESLYLTAINMFLDRPIIGHGPKLFRVKCSDPKYAEGVNSCMTHPHNFYVQLLAETGILGFLFLFILFVYVIFLCIKYFYYAYVKKNKIYSDYHICVLACLLISIWPLIPNGNFFNNYLMMLYCLPLGFLNKKQNLQY